MKTILFKLSFVLGLFLISTPHSQASGPSFVTHIDYAQIIAPADRQGFSFPMALIGGRVSSTEEMPVNVTLRMGGQTYTALTDRAGVFSFFVYANRSNHYQIEAWTKENSGDPEFFSLEK